MEKPARPVPKELLELPELPELQVLLEPQVLMVLRVHSVLLGLLVLKEHWEQLEHRVRLALLVQ